MGEEELKEADVALQLASLDLAKARVVLTSVDPELAEFDVKEAVGHLRTALIRLGVDATALDHFLRR